MKVAIPAIGCSKPLFHASDLLRSFCKKVVETVLSTKLVAPPSVTNQTKRTIAGVTSLHDLSRGSVAKVALISRLNAMIRLVLLKASNSVDV